VKCLGCHAEMMEKTRQTRRGLVYYDICEACGGVWFDAGEMDAVVLQVFRSVEASSRDKAEGISESQRRCPRCKTGWMKKVFFLTYSEILLDHCEKCHGFWLDSGELKLINQNLRHLREMKSKREGFIDDLLQADADSGGSVSRPLRDAVLYTLLDLMTSSR
jgi:Zn-finger nucleic acid-binding protein